ncbi:MAG: AAA family ATPase [Chloroflexi bacterium]|nr:AAA family ATPase [Chloroflexota bacterium]
MPGLDEMLSGGFVPGTSVLVRGAPGTGKTTLALQFLYHGAKNLGENGLLVSFEEFPQSLYRDALALGWDLHALEEASRLRVMFTSPAVFLAALQSPSSELNRTIRELQVCRVALDSVSHFVRLGEDPTELRDAYNMVVNGLKREGTTALLTAEDTRTSLPRQEKGRLSYVVDAIVLLRHIEIDSAMQKGLVILKMRGSHHAKEIRQFTIGPGGIALGQPFERREGLLSGSPRLTPRRS